MAGLGVEFLELLKKSPMTVRDVNRPGGEKEKVPVLRAGGVWWILGANDLACEVTDKLILQQVEILEQGVWF